MIVVTFSPDGQVSLGMNTDNNSSEIESIVIAARKIRLLTKEIEEKLDKKVIIFIDELELSRARSTYEIDKTLIKNLFLATKSINQINNNLHIVLAARDEVLYNLRGDEINKLRDDFGVSMNWWNTNDITVNHNLWKVMFKKIRYSMDLKGENNLRLSDSDLWKRWFPFNFYGKEAWKVFFELTWARPRDFVRLLNLMKENAYQSDTFTENSYNMAVRTYSERAFNEISEELATIFDDQKMDIIIRIIQRLGINFTEDEFITISKELSLDDPVKVIDEMYRVSFVGNHYRINGKSVWRFFYRNNKHPDRSQAFEVHAALHDALGIKGTFRKKVFVGILRKDFNIEDRLDMWKL